MKFNLVNSIYIDEENVDVSFIPPMVRRKLTLLDKVALCAMNKVCQSSENLLVFASRYGEFDRLNKLISQYQLENEVSPTVFSSSVHNNIVGQFSLLKGITKSYNAIGAGDNTFSAGLLESIVSCSMKQDVLFCYADVNTKTEAFACVVSLNECANSLSFVLEKQSDCVFVNQVEECELVSFKKFLAKEVKTFVARDGLFTVLNGER